MKNVKTTKLKRLSSDLMEALRIEDKLLKTNERLSEEEILFLKEEAEEGAPAAEFRYGLYFLLDAFDEKEADKWWTKFFYHANGYGLFRASGIFAHLGDQYYEWSMRCLRRAAWRQHPIAKRMLKFMKECPFKFPEA